MKNEQLLTLCQRHHAVLLFNGPDELGIAVVGSPAGELMDSLRFATQKRVDIECWDQERMDKYRQKSSSVNLPVLHDDANNPVELLNQLFQQAQLQRASDIHFEPTEHHLRIRLRVDGVLHTLSTASLLLMTPLVA